MSAATVTPIRRARRRASARKVKAAAPDVELLEQAAGLVAFVSAVYEEDADFIDLSDLHNVVRTARDLIQRWFDDHEDQNLNYSEELFDGMGLLELGDAVLKAGLTHHCVGSDPFRAMLSAAKDLLRKAVRRPTEAP